MAGRAEQDKADEAALRSSLEAALLEGAREAKRAVRKRVLAAARHDARFATYRFVAARASAMLVAVTVLAGGASVAAATAAPGRPAYVLKRAAERTALAVLPPGALRDALAARFEQRRAYELRELMREGLNDADLRAALKSMGLAGSTADDPYDVLRRELGRIQPSAPDGSTDGSVTGGDELQSPGSNMAPARPSGSDGAEGGSGMPGGGGAGSTRPGDSSGEPGSGGSSEPSSQVGPGPGGSSTQPRNGSVEPSGGVQPAPRQQPGQGTGSR